MKKLLVILMIITTSLTHTACFSQDEPEEKGVNIDSANYRAQWDESYEYDIPIEINDYASFENFLNNHPQQDMEIEDLIKKFNEDFFNENLLYAYIKSEPSGSNKLEADKAIIENGTLILKMSRYVPEVGTADMAARVCIFAIERDTLNQVSTVIANIADEEW